MALKHRSDGFLLIELLVIIVMSVFLFGIAAYQQGLIIQTRHAAVNRLKIATLVRNLIEEIQSDNKLIVAGNRQEGAVTINWQTINPEMSSLNVPRSLKLPNSFRLIKIEAIQQTNKGNPISMQLVTGALDAQ